MVRALRDSGVEFRDVSQHCMVTATMTGPRSARDGLSVIRQALKRARERSWSRVLIDIRPAQVVTPLIRGYDALKRLSELTSMEPSERLAVVFDPATYDRGRAEMLEMTAANWGNPPARAFPDLSSAIHWLTGEADNST